MSQSEIPEKWLEFAAGCAGVNSGALTVEKIAGDGSARIFFRLGTAAASYILMANPDPPKSESGAVDENESFSYVAGILKDSGVKAPEIYGVDKSEGIFILKDFGDTHLQRHVLANRDNIEEVVKSYRELLEILTIIQEEATGKFDSASVFNPAYDEKFMYGKEALYFAEYYVRGICGQSSRELEPELKELSKEAAAKIYGAVFLYRDFQSRNIMLLEEHDGCSRWGLLDFQGARLGPRSYDPASLIYDPYVDLSDELRAELLEYYLNNLPNTVDAEKLRMEFPLVAAHRLMQALGAYGKLGSRDGKSDFLSYVQPALRGLSQLFENYAILGRYGKLKKFCRGTK